MTCESSLFWGVILVVWGASMLINAFFGINIPIIKTVVALGLFYLGYSLLTGNSLCKTHYYKNNYRTFYQHTGTGSYKETIVFGEKKVDFSTLQPHQLPIFADYTITMGAATFRLNPAIPTRIHVQTVMGKAEFPDNTVISVGTYDYFNSNEKPLLEINATVVMGSLVIINQ